MSVAILGGTGAMGRGLAARLARGGVEVVLGSRDAERGAAAAAELATSLGPGAAPITGTDNEQAGTAPVVVLSVPYDGLDANLDAIASTAAEAVLVSMVNPLGFDKRGPYPLTVAEGSVAEHIASRFPRARVVSALNTVAAPVLGDLSHPLDEDVLVAGDDAEAVATVVELVGRIEGARPLVVGALRLSVVLESLTPVLIGINKRYRTHAGIQLSRVTV
ncbi:MAG: NADPH-dependent F420 reductase [Nitriliruptoraceae bacterium]